MRCAALRWAGLRCAGAKNGFVYYDEPINSKSKDVGSFSGDGIDEGFTVSLAAGSLFAGSEAFLVGGDSETDVFSTCFCF